MESNPIISALDWRLKIKKSNSFKKHVRTIIYEDLIENTEHCLLNYLEYLELNKEDKEKTKLQKDYFSNIGINQKDIHKNVANEPNKQNIHKWKKELTKKEIAVYNFVNKRVLLENGYTIEEKSSALFKFFHFILFAVDLLIVKGVNIIKLTVKPLKLYIKIKRRYLLLRK